MEQVNVQPARMVLSNRLVGVAEGASFFNANPSTFSQWAARREFNGMPLPVQVLRSGTLYDIGELLIWWVDWTPVKGAKSGDISDDRCRAYDLPQLPVGTR